jgi:transcription antitermination protein NusB
MGTRRQAREAACQILYQMDLLEDWNSRHIAPFWQMLDGEAPRQTRKYAESIVAGVLEGRERLDETLSRIAKNWTIDRMGHIDRNILRAAAWEMFGEPKLPAGVVIDEWVEIAKKFGSDQSPSFINGILDQIAKSGKDGAA